MYKEDQAGSEYEAHHQSIRLCRSNTEKGEAISIELGVLAHPALVSVTYCLDGCVQVIFYS